MFFIGGDTLGDSILGPCSGSVIDAQVANVRPIIAYDPPTNQPCFAGHPTNFRGAWVGFQPEDGGSTNDRRYLYNIFGWITSGS